MKRIPFNDDNSKKGVEGWYSFIDNKLIVYIKPTNSREDWISDFIAFREYDKLADCKIHAGFRVYAHWMNDFIIQKANVKAIKQENIIIIGYSMGGGIAQILGEFSNYYIISIDGPRTTNKLTNKKSTLYYNNGSLVYSVPFWFKQIENKICLNDKWEPFWRSHENYDINKIIEGVI